MDEEELVGFEEEQPFEEAEPEVEHEAEAEAEDDGGHEEEAPKKKRGVIVQKPKANVYTVMMIVSLVALTIGSLCLYGEMKQYNMDFRARGAR